VDNYVDKHRQTPRKARNGAVSDNMHILQAKINLNEIKHLKK